MLIEAGKALDRRSTLRKHGGGNIDKMNCLDMGKIRSVQQNVSRDRYIASTCLLAILCGFAATRGVKNIDPGSIQTGFEKSLLVWFVYAVGSGFILKFPASGKYADVFRDAIPSSVVFSLTVGLKALIVYLFILLTGKIEIPFWLSSWPIALAVESVTKLVLLVLVLLVCSVATCAVIGIASIGSESIAKFIQQAIKFDSRKIGRLAKLLKALVGLVTAFYALWAEIM